MKPISRRLHLGFRGRVLGLFAVLVAGATFGGLVLQRAVLLSQFNAEIETSLQQERDELEALAQGNDPETGEPFGADVRAVFDTFLTRNLPASGEAYFTFVRGVPYSSSPAPIDLADYPDLAARWGALTIGEWGWLSTEAGRARYLAVPLTFEERTTGVFVVVNFVERERDEIESHVRVSAVVAAAVLVCAMGIAWSVAGRLLRPVRQLTRAAEAISDADLSQRIPVEGNDEIARLAQRFNEMLDRLAASFAVQRAFVDDAGHELRTPITIVRGHLELMGSEPAEQRATIELVTEELDRMARIVDDLLLLAKAEHPDFIQPSSLEVADLTADLLAKARALGDRRWRLDASAVGLVHADRQRLTQAVLNLARNAVEHTTIGAEIGLGSSTGGGEVRLWVRDTGPGVDHRDREQIFERFTRGRTGRRRSDGAGLGLAIVRSVALGHHGRVELDSEPGHGATFTIVLPTLSPITESNLDELDEDVSQ
ncbi:MAG: HAMP domain-containing sensor histidine kinase [Ilumatobacteraceae bacterium]